ncbi:MAG: hypothetical protein JWO78_535 [Micavibrio sp.]|nr:hypothetical protein [Micavibrio sp.]
MKSHLINLYVPLNNPEGQISAAYFEEIQKTLADRFGGVTAFTRAPAEGLWKPEKKIYRDDIVIFEVLTGSFDRSWWVDYRKNLEDKLLQEKILITVQEVFQI